MTEEQKKEVLALACGLALAIVATGCSGAMTHARGPSGGTITGVTPWNLAECEQEMAQACGGRFVVLRSAGETVHYACSRERTASRE